MSQRPEQSELGSGKYINRQGHFLSAEKRIRTGIPYYYCYYFCYFVYNFTYSGKKVFNYYIFVWHTNMAFKFLFYKT